ncbi:MAG: ferritin-like domain-containing protein [Marmoricola sp.]
MTPTQALVAALKAEYAAVYLYGLIGGRASRGDKPAEVARIKNLYAAHRTRRDQLIALLGARKVATPAPAVAYKPPIDPVSPSTRTACAREIEVRSESVYTQLVASTTGPERAFAINALDSVSKAGVALGQTPSAFPGLVL